MLGNKAMLGLAGVAVTSAVGGGYFLLSDGKLLSKAVPKKTGSFCFALRSSNGGFGSCVRTFKEESEFREYLEAQGQSSYNGAATGLEEALEKARKAYESGLTAFVYLDSGSVGSGRKWVFPEDLQEAWGKEYST
ncbi:hypothetical protein MHC_01335 [Mycoplasma haemocanis str. Illinois]|uniref:Uncharacterized protein n=1 Tax=Mycoplasma haemocanis (strain Illinois) TaxID=1111676 RepID=H6N661_MYCHN|nr:hypothetical protein [Mycoplasma haemocanis]AEW45133.2 hypothetical protein MHC_01335 [Mycoplasma haemocanis str. Illinois]